MNYADKIVLVVGLARVAWLPAAIKEPAPALANIKN